MTGDAVTPHQIQVRDDEQQHADGQQNHVCRVPALSVSAPIAGPPRMMPAIYGPTTGVLFAMLIVTTVAQYAR